MKCSLAVALMQIIGLKFLYMTPCSEVYFAKLDRGTENDEFSYQHKTIFHLLPNMLVSCLFDAFVAEKLVPFPAHL